MIVAAWFVFGLDIATFHAQSTNFITGAYPETKGRAMGIHGIGGAIGNFSSATMLFVGFFAQPGGGMIYDRIGGRWLFALSALAAAVGLFLFTSQLQLPPLLPIVLIGAAVMATFPPSLAMASDIAKGGNVGMSVGLVFGASRAMAAFTPALTGYMADQIGLRSSLQWLVVFALAACLLAILLPGKR